MTTYRTRRNLFAREEQWSLAGDTLTIQPKDRAPQSLRLAEVVKLRLEYTPSRFEWNTCSCFVTLRDGRSFICCSDGYEGASSAATVARNYAVFVRELHGLLIQHAPGCEFWAGASRSGYWWGTFTLALAALLAVGAVIFFSQAGWPKTGPAKITAAFLLLPVAFLWIGRNRPRRYSPNQIPSEVLPRGT